MILKLPNFFMVQLHEGRLDGALCFRSARRWHMSMRRREVAESRFHALFERGIRRRFAMLRRVSGLIGAIPELTKPGQDIVLFLRGVRFAAIRAIGVRAPRYVFPPSFLSLLLHEPGTEALLRRVLIVRPASQPDILEG